MNINIIYISIYRFYFYSSKPPLGLGFSSTFLGTMNVVGSVANLAGIALFQAHTHSKRVCALVYLLCTGHVCSLLRICALVWLLCQVHGC